MDSTRTVTSIFIVVAFLALGALAISVSQRQNADLAESPLPGLLENIDSMSRITEFPSGNIRSVIVMRQNGEELTVKRSAPDQTAYEFAASPPDNINPYSAILFANASFLDQLGSSESFVVSGIDEQEQLGKLTYTSFDGLVLELVVFRQETATGIRMVAAHAPKLAARFSSTDNLELMSTAKIIEISHQLNGRVYLLEDQPM